MPIVTSAARFVGVGNNNGISIRTMFAHGTFTLTTTASPTAGKETSAGEIVTTYPLPPIPPAVIKPSMASITSWVVESGRIAIRAPYGQGLHINGTVTLDVNDGEIQVNSIDDDAVRIIGTPEIYADALNICGDADPTGGWEFEPDFVVNTGVSEIPDPLRDLPEPTWDPADDLAASPGEILEITGG